MKVVLLAGGLGTRLSEETVRRPKPMVEIGGMPILWHIMKIYSYYGYNDFIICLGYKGYQIKEFFANYFLHMADVTFDLGNNEMTVHHKKSEPWKVTLIDTGLNTMTGGRIKRIKPYIEGEKFMVTYGDGVSNVNVSYLVKFHESHNGIGSMTVVQPSGRFGAVEVDDYNKITTFREKPKGENAWINGGFFVLDREVFDFIEDDDTVFEKDPLEKMTQSGKLYSYKHSGFWKPMDTLREKKELEDMWESCSAPWKVWND